MRQCPKCQNWTLEFDDYFGRFRCFDADCGWMAASSVERAMRLQRSYIQPRHLCERSIPELDITVSAEYDEANDALIFDFGLNTPTFELPEGDGRMVWKITRTTRSVAGFVLLGAREFSGSEVKINFDARKADIEEVLKRTPLAIAAGRVTRVLIEHVEVTAHARHAARPASTQVLTNVFHAAVDEYEKTRNG